jgi:hypothetical protein
MSLLSALVDTLGLVEGRLPTEGTRPNEAPSKVPPMSPADELQLLEKRALERGIPSDELARVRQIGECPAQVQTRIRHLHEWLAAN